MNNFKKIVSLFLFGMVVSPLCSMDFNVVDAALDKSKPTSFLAIMQPILQQKNEAKAKQVSEQEKFHKEELRTILAEDFRKQEEQKMVQKIISAEIFNQGSPNTIAYSPRTPITPGKSILKTSQNYIPKKK